MLEKRKLDKTQQKKAEGAPEMFVKQKFSNFVPIGSFVLFVWFRD
jgi:hypothetical protein